MSFHTYILYSQSRLKYYTGSCEDLTARIDRHNSSVVPSTRLGTPWELVWSKELPTRGEAMVYEKKIKKRGAKRFLEDLEKRRQDSH